MTTLLLAGLVLAACTTAPPGLAEVYAPVVRPEYAPLLTELTGAPRIDMEVWYQPTRNHLEGRMQVSGELGVGAIDHAEPLRLLHGAGYDGYFSVEVIHRPGSAHDADAVLASYAEGFRRIVDSF